MLLKLLFASLLIPSGQPTAGQGYPLEAMDYLQQRFNGVVDGNVVTGGRRLPIRVARSQRTTDCILTLSFENRVSDLGLGTNVPLFSIEAVDLANGRVSVTTKGSGYLGDRIYEFAFGPDAERVAVAFGRMAEWCREKTH